MGGSESGGPPRVNAAGIAALRATRPWALFAGIVALVLAALGVIDACVYSLGSPPALPSGTPPHVAAMVSGLATLGAVVGVVVNGLFAWFALRYGRGIKLSLEGASGERLEEALSWQRRYWTLQGVLMIIMIIVFVCAIVAAIIVGTNIAAHDAAWVAPSK